MAGFENYEEMFSQSIGLKDPWKVERAEYDEEKKRSTHICKLSKDSKIPMSKMRKNV